MKSKKIERLQAEIEECRTYQIAAGDSSDSPQWQDMQRRIEKARKEIRSAGGKMSKHTPGPWGIKRNFYRESIRIIGEECTPIADVFATIGGSTGTQTMEANAALIAAAPELAEALEYAIETLQELGLSKDHSAIIDGAAALKRAGR